MRVAANTTFTDAEVRALCELLRAAVRGGDSRIIARNPGVRSAMGKLVRLERRRAQGGRT